MSNPRLFRTIGMTCLTLASFYAILKIRKRSSKQELQLASKEEEIIKLNEALNVAKADVDTKDGRVEKLTKELEGVQSRIGEAQRRLQGLRNENRTLGQQITRKDEELEFARDESRAVKEKYEQTVSLLDSRTKELRSAEVFLTKADSLSGADIISMLNALNSEIYQTAALVAESYEFRQKVGLNGDVPSHEDMDAAKARQETTVMVGSRMVELLKSTHHHEDPTLVQIALQVGLSSYSKLIISEWEVEDSRGGRLLSEIYRRLRCGEEQTISGRWRALARAYVQQIDQGRTSMFFIDVLANILITAGAHETRKELQNLITSKYIQRINLITKNVQTMRKAIGEDITSCDFGLIFVEQNQQFDTDIMEDSFSQGPPQAGDNPVLCTTDLGLLRSVKLPGKADNYQETVMLRPKVVLQSGIEDMLG